MTGVHPPKRETFDLDARTNTDPKGIVRPVETYELTAHGLYLARAADHATFHAIESWLVPELGIRVTDFHFRPGHERAHDFYVDIMTVEPGADRRRWHTVDLYLDVLCARGRFTQVVDSDELAAALAEGVLEPELGEYAMERAFEVATGIAAHDHDLVAWLDSEGVPTRWQRRG